MQLEYEIAALIAMIGLSGYFSGLEVALVSIRISKIEQMIKDKAGFMKSQAFAMKMVG